nr:oligosaccharide flippase family protein [uncultured Alsobacter sp.]
MFALGNGLSRAVAYALPPLLAGWIAPEEMGLVALLTTAAVILRTVLGLGLTTSAGAVYYEVPVERRGEVIATTALLLGTATVAGVLLCLVAPAVPGLPLAQAGALMPALAFAGAGLQLLAQPYALALQFQGRPLAHLAVTAAAAAAGVALALVLVVGLGRGAWGWLEAGALGALVGVVLAARAAGTPLLAASAPVARKLMRLGWPFIPGAAFMAALQGAGPFILARVDGLAAAGVYNAGYGLGMTMSLATTGFSSAWFPYFQSFAARQHEAPHAFGRVLMIAIGAFGCAAILFYALAPLARLLLVDPRYGGAVHVVGDVALSQALLAIWSILVPALYFSRKIWIASAVQGLGAGVAVIVTYVLVLHAGAANAGLGAVAGACVMIAVQWVVNGQADSPAGSFVRFEHAWAGCAVGICLVLARTMADSVGSLASAGTGGALAGCAAVAVWAAGRRASLWA